MRVRTNALAGTDLDGRYADQEDHVAHGRAALRLAFPTPDTPPGRSASRPAFRSAPAARCGRTRSLRKWVFSRCVERRMRLPGRGADVEAELAGVGNHIVGDARLDRSSRCRVPGRAGDGWGPSRTPANAARPRRPRRWRFRPSAAACWRDGLSAREPLPCRISRPRCGGHGRQARRLAHHGGIKRFELIENCR